LVIDGLLKVAGREPAKLAATISASSLTFESSRALGNVWTLTEIWKELGFSDLRRVFRRTRHTIDVEALIRIMVLNRLCDPDSKLGVLRWLQTVALPDIEVKAVSHQPLLRSNGCTHGQPGCGGRCRGRFAAPAGGPRSVAFLLRHDHHSCRGTLHRRGRCSQVRHGEITAELAWKGLRLVLAHDPTTALEQRQKQQAKIDELQRQANAWVGKLDEQDLGAKKRGRKLSDSGAKARFYHEVRESHLCNIIKVAPM